MKNIVIVFIVILFAVTLSAQSNSEKIDRSVVKNVVLINTNPWEVLMSKNGDVLAKIQHLPNFLKGYEKSEIKVEDVVIKEELKIVKAETTPVVNAGFVKNIVEVSMEESPQDIKEVFFNVGSALMRFSQISLLDEIAVSLNENKNLKFKLYGFSNEPEYRSHILSKRRFDAVLAYLKIKAVDIDKQIIVGSSVSGENNKIVFIEIR